MYCKENFFSPKKETKFDIKNAAYILLEPGQILIVPKNWWHYVESLDMSLSVNSWIPLKNDLEAQIEEAIVKFIIEKFVQNEDINFQKYILNPNQVSFR